MKAKLRNWNAVSAWARHAGVMTNRNEKRSSEPDKFLQEYIDEVFADNNDDLLSVEHDELFD